MCKHAQEQERRRWEALAAVDLEFDLIEEIGEAAPIPADIDAGAVDRGAEVGLKRGVIGRSLLRAFDAEGFADGFVVVCVRFDLFHQSAKTAFDAGGDGGNGSRKHRGDRRATRRNGAAALASSNNNPTPRT